MKKLPDNEEGQLTSGTHISYWTASSIVLTAIEELYHQLSTSCVCKLHFNINFLKILIAFLMTDVLWVN